MIKCAHTIGNSDDEDGAESLGGGTTNVEKIEASGDKTRGDGGIADDEEGVRQRGDIGGDVEDEDGVGGRARVICGAVEGLLDVPSSSLTQSVRIAKTGSHFFALYLPVCSLNLFLLLLRYPSIRVFHRSFTLSSPPFTSS
nr:hypothetical protein Iba_chr15dCG7500 [Ipomoea batatas]